MSNLIDRQQAIDAVEHITSSMSVCVNTDECHGMKRMQRQAVLELANMPSAQPKRGRWILDRSGAYCCSECMEPCAGYVMMKPRDKFCKMCGAKMEGEQNEDR